MSFPSESCDEHLIIFLDKVQRAVSWAECDNLFAVLDELDSNALSDSRVGLFGFDTDLLEDDAFRVRASSEGVGLQRSAEVALLVSLVGPSVLAAKTDHLPSGVDSVSFGHGCDE